MKHHLLRLSLLLLSGLFVSLSGQDTLLLFHPTAYNLEVIQNLLDEKVFDLEDYHILGVYHEKEAYDYIKAEEYVEHRSHKRFSLRVVSGALEPENIYGNNPCTPQFTSLFKLSRGALFMGGPDIPPDTYGEKVHLLTSVTDPFRHYFELSYLFHLLGGSQAESWMPYLEKDPGYLISGICLGMQSLNVATGGTMVQDIPTEIYHTWNAEDLLDGDPDQMHRNYADKVNRGCEAPTSYHFHRVKLEKRELLSKGIGFKSAQAPLVLSSHHQALEKLGSSWEVIATSMDGKIIEAIQHSIYPNVLGVQFHPEKPGLFDPSIEHPQNCNSTINFQESIKDNDSFAFHLAYWDYLASILQKKR